ncbi:MAG: radical SAM protein [Spirochaetales bacterium]|nr:radical SAM protein [Spirochaetales bacterium]
MSIRIFQTGWNYSQDGPGNRLLLHFQGCNFDCPWCSNPEGRSVKGELFVRPEHLDSGVCPHGAVSPTGLNRKICRGCSTRECLNQNRNQGISFTATEYRVEELLQMAEESVPLFFDGGGVTITGGEATLQFEGLISLLTGLKERGIHTALETNGSHRDLERIMPLTDLLIFDLKHWNFPGVRDVLKNSGYHVIGNLQKACSQGINTLARITVIPGFNSSTRDMERFADLFAFFPHSDSLSLELLYFHSYGRPKWEAIGQTYRGPETEISEDQKNEYKAIFESRGISIIST